MMDKFKGSGDVVTTINMLNSKMSEQIPTSNILLDYDLTIRETNFYGAVSFRSSQSPNSHSS